jgi:hypothetical protein
MENNNPNKGPPTREGSDMSARPGLSSSRYAGPHSENFHNPTVSGRYPGKPLKAKDHQQIPQLDSTYAQSFLKTESTADNSYCSRAPSTGLGASVDAASNLKPSKNMLHLPVKNSQSAKGAAKSHEQDYEYDGLDYSKIKLPCAIKDQSFNKAGSIDVYKIWKAPQVYSNQLVKVNNKRDYTLEQYRKSWTLAVRNTAEVLVSAGFCADGEAEGIIEHILKSVSSSASAASVVMRFCTDIGVDRLQWSDE